MSSDPWVQEEIRGLLEDQERRSYEADLRRNPDEQSRIDDVVSAQGSQGAITSISVRERS